MHAVVGSILENQPTRTVALFKSRFSGSILVSKGGSILVSGHRGLEIRRIFNLGIAEVVGRCLEVWQVDHDHLLAPMFEAKLIQQFDHRFATYLGSEPTVIEEPAKRTPTILTKTFYAIPYSDVEDSILTDWTYRWLPVWRDITNSGSERTVVACVIPRMASDFTLRVGFPVSAPPATCAILVANLNCFPFDYCARQAFSGNHLSDYIFKQLPIIPPATYADQCEWAVDGQTLQHSLVLRVLELTYTAWDLEPFAQDCGWSGPPFRWDEERRFLLRCELDAAFFHLYLPATAGGHWKRALVAEGAAHDESPEDLERLKASFLTPRDAVAYIMDTFSIVKTKDGKKYNGDYRTKRVILEIYDAMQDSIRSGQPYQTRLDPPPADPRCCHPPRVTIIDLSDAAANVLPFRRVRPHREDRYETCVPLLSVKVAAGGFGENQDVDFADWVEVKASQPLRRGMFVAQVVGHSMEPVIPDGKYCLFQFKAPDLKNEMIGLFQLFAAEDPETGGRFTVKRLKIATTRDPDGELHRVARLVPENPAFKPIPVEDEDVKFVAEFLEVLQ